MTTEPITVRYWASARAAAGVAEEQVDLGGVTLAELIVRLGADRPALARVMGHCSVLVGDEPATSRDPASVRIPAGVTVEFLPPFAGG